MPGAYVHHGSCLAVLETGEADSIDAIVTDPPYGLGFMSKGWDHEVPGVPFWAAFLRVAKPGAHLVAFGGTRTWHRIACAIEDAGWEIRDTLAWLYGQGFPKSLDVSKAIDDAAGAQRARGPIDPARAGRLINQGGDYTTEAGWSAGNRRVTIDPPATDDARRWNGWGTALKPAFEPIILARKPLVGTVAANVLAHGVGGLNIDACRIEVEKGGAKGGAGYTGGVSAREVGREHGDGVGFSVRAGDPQDGQGRWPANAVLDEEAAAMLNVQSGVLTSGKVTKRYSATLVSSVALGAKRRSLHPGAVFSDSGGASRFFYCAKASRSERTHGGTIENKHPTVKPLALMRWLVRLVTPPGGLVLDPFCGSGTTLVAARLEGFDAYGIEQDAESVATARARVEAVCAP